MRKDREDSLGGARETVFRTHFIWCYNHTDKIQTTMDTGLPLSDKEFEYWEIIIFCNNVVKVVYNAIPQIRAVNRSLEGVNTH